jgi:nucleoside-diphosphate-sugar epimerase
MHVASDLTLNPDPRQVIPMVLSGVKNALTAAARNPSVKRFVYTSSSAAVTAPIVNKKFHVDVSTWNDADVEAAWASPPYNDDRKLAVYAASKTLAEKECWRFIREEKPAFILNAVLPNCNIGRILSKEQPASTGGWYKKMWEGDAETLKLLRDQFPPQHYVNVTDTALLHLAALLEEDVIGERLLAFAGPFNFNDTADLMEKIDADGYGHGNGSRQYDRIKDASKDLKTVDTKRAQELLRRYGRPGFTSLEISLREAVTS